MLLERRKHLKILESVGFLKELLFEFVEELKKYERNINRYLLVTADSVHVKTEAFGFVRIESDCLFTKGLYFDLLPADENTNLKTVIVENFLATRFDVEVETLSLKNLENFRVVNHHGDYRVAVIVDHPRDLISEVAKLILFCNVYIEY